MRMRQISEEILYADEPVVRVGPSIIERLKEIARGNRRRRCRLCAHTDVNDRLHEMLIVHAEGTYVRPHKHLGKPESFHVIEGMVDVILFAEEGRITHVIRMGDHTSGREFYYRISEPLYHTLLIRSEFLVFHEITSGPFVRSDTLFAPWAPAEDDPVGQAPFLEGLAQAAERMRNMAGDTRGEVPR